MKVLLAVAIWGRDYVKTFADYALASQLSASNIPKLAEEHELTYHIMTTRKDGARLQSHPSIRELAKHCRIEWDYLEQHGYNPRFIPEGPDGKKYSFLSLLQNIAISKSVEHDCLIFNYADFIWTDGSLPNSVRMLDDGVDAVLSFCLPVDKDKGIRELKKFRVADGILDLAPRAGADIAIRCLHREAKLRYWDGPAFSVTPTYLLWPVGSEGLVVRAYHQTVLVLRVKRDDPTYREGIQYGSLDGYFTAHLAKHANSSHATNSDEVMVFSLYDTVVDSQIPRGSSRERSMRECLMNTISWDQRKFALRPIEVRRTYEHSERWTRVARESLDVVDGFHRTTAVGADMFGGSTPDGVTLTDLDRHWRMNSLAAQSEHLKGALMDGYILLYKKALLPIASGRLGRALKRIVGASRARALRLAVQGLIYDIRPEPERGISGARRKPMADAPARDVKEAKALLSLDAESLIGHFMPRTAAVDAVPGLTIGHRSVACFRAGIAVEAVLGGFTDLDELDRVLAKSETALRFVVEDAPLWSEGYRALARNHWFQSRFQEALQHFAAGERCLPRMAERAGWDAKSYVMLPRNCAHVIGLMGHIDAFVKHKILSNDDRPYYLLAPDSEIVNRPFLDYWARYITVVTDPTEIARLSRFEPAYSVNWNWIMPSGEDDVVDVHTSMARVQRRWQAEGRAPLLHLDDAHSRLLANQKAAWGMKEDDWFVCLHVRSAGFYTEKAGTAQDFRNTPISDYYPLIRSIVDAGGWLVRMGDQSAPSLDVDKCGAHPNRVIDYAHRPERSAELDVALSASCRLFVSSPSGLHTIAHAFGRPVCLINFPIYAGFPWHPGDIFIPQFYFSQRLQRNLTLRELLSSDLVYANHNFHLQRAGIELRRNKPGDIVEAVREALDPGAYAVTDGIRAVRARQIFDRFNRDYNVNISGRLGAHFAAAYADALAPDGECASATTFNPRQS